MSNVLPGLAISYVPNVFYKLYQQTIFPYLFVFMLGAFISEYQTKFKPVLSKKIALVVLYIALFVGLPFDIKGAGYNVFSSTLQVLFAVSFGEVIKTGIVKRDISYEIYLVHMIIVNIFVELGMRQNWTSFWLVLIISVIVAYGLYMLNAKVIKWLDTRFLRLK